MILSFFENYADDFMMDYKNRLLKLVTNGMITEYQYTHFLNRGITMINPEKLGLDHLSKFLPHIAIATSNNYVEKMKIPYQATSFVGAKIRPTLKSIYAYKLSGKPAGGVPLLTANRKALGDNLFASTHRILLGAKGILVSAANLMVNQTHIWDWQFFGNRLKISHRNLYSDLIQLNKKVNPSNTRYQIVTARSKGTFKKLNIIDNFEKRRIAVLDPNNGVKVIFVTNQEGYEYAAKKIRPSEAVEYIVTGKNFDIFEGMVQLKRHYGIDVLLNDGGRQMSNGLRDVGLVAEERITLEPYPGPKIFPSLDEIDPTSIMAASGTGLDGGELEGTIRINSTPIGRERANVYAYPLDDKKVLN